jgi:hypothetical protein
MALHIIAVISCGLALDRALVSGWLGQHLATVWTLGVFVWLYRLGQRDERAVLVLCMLIAGFGEVVLSLVWGLYDYQFANVPLFVPPGHALLMTLGLLTARHLNLWQAWSVVFGGIVWGAYAWGLFATRPGFDQFGVALFLVFVFCMLVSRAKALYAAMFVLALIMELYGTALGNWAWQALVPGTPLTAANPPYSAGAFYCLLDLLVLGALRVCWVVVAPRVVAAK